MLCYIPMTADIITPGHIGFLKKLSSGKYCKNCLITIGLLTDKALEGYKTAVMSWEDRKYILENLDIRDRFGFKTICKIVPQDSLNPYHNLMEFKQTAIASGDGWEKIELDGIDKWQEESHYQFPVLTIRLDGENKKSYSSSKIKDKIISSFLERRNK